MQIGDVRKLSSAELQSRIDDVREALFKLRFQMAFGQATDTSQFRKNRRDLARLLTVEREHQLADLGEQAMEEEE